MKRKSKAIAISVLSLAFSFHDHKHLIMSGSSEKRPPALSKHDIYQIRVSSFRILVEQCLKAVSFLDEHIKRMNGPDMAGKPSLEGTKEFVKERKVKRSVSQRNTWEYTIYRWNGVECGICLKIVCGWVGEVSGGYSWDRTGCELIIIVTGWIMRLLYWLLWYYFVYVLELL